MYKVRVSNVPRWISELHLKQFFEPCGEIVTAAIALAKAAPRPLGYGFIAFKTIEGAKNAVAKSGARLDGANIIVDMVEEGATEIVEPEGVVNS